MSRMPILPITSRVLLTRLRKHWLCSTLLWVMVLLASPLAVAGDKHNKRGQELDEAVRSVRNQTRGQILSAKTHQDRQKSYHKIRVLTPDGRVRNVRLPADKASPPRPDHRPPPPRRDRDDEWRR